jgi:hypothetical protein
VHGHIPFASALLGSALVGARSCFHWSSCRCRCSRGLAYRTSLCRLHPRYCRGRLLYHNRRQNRRLLRLPHPAYAPAYCCSCCPSHEHSDSWASPPCSGWSCSCSRCRYYAATKGARGWLPDRQCCHFPSSSLLVARAVPTWATQHSSWDWGSEAAQEGRVS